MCSFAIWITVNVFQGFRHSPRHARRSAHARVIEEKPSLVQIPESEPDSSAGLRKRKVKKRVLPEFYQSVQVTPTRKLVGTNSTLTMTNKIAVLLSTCSPPDLNASVDVAKCSQPRPVMKWIFTSHFLPCCKFEAKICRTQSPPSSGGVIRWSHSTDVQIAHSSAVNR